MVNKTLIINIYYTHNKNTNNIDILSMSKDSLSLPQIDLTTVDPKITNIDMRSLIEKIHNKCVNINFNWIKYKFLDLDISYLNDSIITAIYYATYIPSNTNIGNNYWIDIKPYVTHYDTLRKLICML